LFVREWDLPGFAKKLAPSSLTERGVWPSAHLTKGKDPEKNAVDRFLWKRKKRQRRSVLRKKKGRY